MRLVVQKVLEASVKVDNKFTGKIGKGLLLFVGIENEDNQEDANWLIGKVIKMRLFNDASDIMNLSIQDVDGKFLVISQFTLHASTKKGNRPSYYKAAKSEIAIPLYEYFLEQLWIESSIPVQAGVFGAHMEVSLVNDGPVTIIIDSKNKE